jgi:hypothetical protein
MKKLIVSILTLSVIALAGCSSPEPVQTAPDYNTVTTAITEYEDAYREFVNGGEGSVELITGTARLLSELPVISVTHARQTADSSPALLLLHAAGKSTMST